MTITAIHRVGDDACGRIAFWYDDEGATDDRLEAARVTLPDGSKPNNGDVMRCGACGAEIGIGNLDPLPGHFEETE